MRRVRSLHHLFPTSPSSHSSIIFAPSQYHAIPRADLFKHFCSDYDSLLHLPPVYLSYLTGPDHQHCSLTGGIWLLPFLTRSGSLALTAQYLAHVQVDHRHLAKPSDCQYHSSLEAPTRSLQASRSRDLPLSVRSTCGFFYTLATTP